MSFGYVESSGYSELDDEQWDLLLYVASYLAGHDAYPTRKQIRQAKLDGEVFQKLVAQGVVREEDGRCILDRESDLIKSLLSGRKGRSGKGYVM